MTDEEKNPDENLDEEEKETPESEETPENKEDTSSGDSDDDKKDEEDEEDEEEEPIPDDIEPETREKIEEPKKDKEDDEEVDSDDEKIISKVIDKKLSPLTKKIQQQNDEIEVNSYIVDNPEMAKYKPLILKYITHPAYKNIPVKNIANMVSANDQQKIGAEKERKAKDDADKTKDGSDTSRQEKGKTDWANASNEEVEAEIAKAKGMRV